MFGKYRKRKQKDFIDSMKIDKMREFSNETEKVFKSLIDNSITDFPDSVIEHSSYGIYKARLATTLMIAIGVKFSKQKIGFDSTQEFFVDVQIATAIAHEPFSDSNNNNYLSRESIERKTGEIIKYFLLTIKNNQEKISLLNFTEEDDFFKKIKIYFHNCTSESVHDKNIMKELIKLNEAYFDNLTRQNLKIMADFMNI